MGLAENLENHFRQTHSLPDSFKFWRWEMLPIGGPPIYYELEGGVVNSVCKSGPRKGRPNYRKATDIRTFRMTVEEYQRLFSK